MALADGVVSGATARAKRAAVRAAVHGPLAGWLGRKRRAPVGGRVLDRQLAAMLALDDLTGDSAVAKLTPADARRHMLESIAIVGPAAPRDVTVHELELPGAVGPRAIAVHVPRDLARPSPAVFYVHGGGWVTGDLRSHAAFCSLLAARARVVVVAVTYRLAPEHPFPAAVDDTVALFRHVPQLAERFGLELSRVAIAGDSAGGNLCAVLARHVRGEPFTPRAQFLVYPATDCTRSFESHRTYGDRYFLTSDSIEWYRSRYLRTKEEQRDPDASPFFAAELAGLAPAFVYTAGFDPLVDEGLAYANRLREAGVAVHYRCFESLVHGFTLMGGAIDAAARATDEIIEDIGRELAG